MTDMLNKVTDAWTRAWGDGDTRAFEDLAAPEYRRHSKTGEEGIEEVTQQIRQSSAAFSEFTVEVVNAIEDDGVIAILWRSTGKHTGEFMGVPPTGRTVTVMGSSFIKHRDGKLIDESSVWDPRELLSSMRIWHLGDFLRQTT
ncbi:ester cyclase [Rothia koreensis]|jgi:steroid delta-isomerase-like uncharacterized protein|uniref:ester cyclase n=1 Tax=Rothia koreensis TaxID=592378 RepID=UPI001930F054|nr:ester cyclase [Rothia koreensis]